MSLETATYIYNLVATNPTSTDPKSEGDDHIRVIKSVIKNSFAGFPGMVVVTGTEAQGATVNDYAVTITPAPSAYTASTLIVFKATHANTGAVTLQINALGTKSLLAVDNTALKSGDIESGGAVFAYYDGTSFYLVSGNDRANRNGETYSGAHNFTSATPTVPTKSQGDNSTNAASTAYVDTSMAAEAATRLAVDATKADILSPALTGIPTAPTAANGTSTTQLATCAFVVTAAFNSALPGQAGNAGKFVTTDGVTASWATVLPAQTGNAGKFITTDGSTASWVTMSASGSDLYLFNSGNI